jgi:hypothetical protein
MNRSADRPAARPSVRPLLLGLALALGLAACTPPPAPFSYDLDVVYFWDALEGADAAIHALSGLEADHPELSVTYTADRAEVLVALTTDPHLVVVFNQDQTMPDEFRDALVDWVAGGGRLVVGDWDWRPELLAALGASWDGTQNGTSVAFDDARLAAGTTPPLAITDPGRGTFSTGLEATDGTVAARFADDKAAVVYGNAGRTAAVGFLNDTVDLDDGGAFFANLFDLMLRGTAISGF